MEALIMRGGRWRKGAWMVVALLGQVAARAAPSGLALMPTCDLVPPGEAVFELQVDGTVRGGSTDTRLVNAEFGLTDRMEAGVDYDASLESSERWLGNAKLEVWCNPADDRCASIGVRNWGEENQPEGYGVTCATWGRWRARAGASYSEERRLDALVGGDYSWGDGWFAYGEWTSGPENAGALGVNVPLGKGFALLTALVLPNEREEDTGFSAHLVWGGPLFTKTDAKE